MVQSMGLVGNQRKEERNKWGLPKSEAVGGNVYAGNSLQARFDTTLNLYQD